MAHCVTHNISFDPQLEWCIYCGKPKTAELVVVENTSTNSAIMPVCPSCRGEKTFYSASKNCYELCGGCGGSGKPAQ